jgi:Leucine-rich repeat (LRR) protein
LWISDNQVTDVTQLAKLTHLSELLLNGNKITGTQQTMLKKALPNCKIEF